MSGLISVDAALELLLEAAPDPGSETVALEDAQGRIVAEPVIARFSRPPAPVSAMDGYAVRLADVGKAGARLTIIGEAPAGMPFPQPVGKGEAVRIFTGGLFPEGADHVVIQEDTHAEDGFVTCHGAYETSAHIRQAGIDFSEGETLLEPGVELGAAELALVAAANVPSLPVRKRLRVGILANGNELRPPGSTLGPGEIVSSNPYGLAALVRDRGALPVDLGIAEDTLDSLQTSIRNAGEIDVFLPVGGASVGDHDLMRPAFAAEGFEPVFGKVAVRPGKPTWFSRRGRQHVLGLPGNPASALVCAWVFLKPLLTGAPPRSVQARLTAPVEANGNREHFMRAALSVAADGTLAVTPAASQDSSLIRPFILNAALIRRRPGDPSLDAGEPVICLPLKAL